MTNLLAYRDDFFYPVEQEFNRFFSDFFSDRGNTKNLFKETSYPKLDVISTNGEYVIEASVPGVKTEDLEIQVIPAVQGVPQYVQISGKMEEHNYTDNVVWHTRELKRSMFKRSVVLPDTLDGDPVATFNKGLLKLVWKIKSKKENIPKPKLIEIKSV